MTKEGRYHISNNLGFAIHHIEKLLSGSHKLEPSPRFRIKQILDDLQRELEIELERLGPIRYEDRLSTYGKALIKKAF